MTDNLQKLLGMVKQKSASNKEAVDHYLKELQDIEKSKQVNALNAQKKMILKDKIMFHKAAILVYTDVEADINTLLSYDK